MALPTQALLSLLRRAVAPTVRAAPTEIIPLSRALPIGPVLMHRLRRLASGGFRVIAWVRCGLHRTPVPPLPGPICIAGFHGSVLGIGEAARTCSTALRAAGAEVVDWDISALFGHLVRQGDGYETTAPELAAAMVIFLNPLELVQLVAMTGAAPFRGRFCVGAWAWELQTAPRSWRAAMRYVDEVWACSHFVAGAVAQIAPAGLPVRVLPHALALPPAQPARASDGGGGKTVVLMVFDAGSGFVRKNPIAAVRAFRRANDAGQALLVCKVGGAGTAPDLMAELTAEIGGAQDVRLINDWFTAEQMAALNAEADVVLSLHRSEGFGLVLAQAMAAGKPVLATGWSGNLDFMTAEDSVLVDYALVPVRDRQGFYRGGLWAEPDIEDAAAKLKALLNDPDRRRVLGERARAAIAQKLDPAALGRRARAWLGHDIAAP